MRTAIPLRGTGHLSANGVVGLGGGGRLDQVLPDFVAPAEEEQAVFHSGLAAVMDLSRAQAACAT